MNFTAKEILKIIDLSFEEGEHHGWRIANKDFGKEYDLNTDFNKEKKETMVKILLQVKNRNYTK